MALTRLEVTLAASLDDRSYPVFIDPDEGAETRLASMLATIGIRGTVGLLTDETVARIHLPRFRAALLAQGLALVEAVVPDGEASKSLACTESVAEIFVHGGLDRRGTVLALGGGMVGDLAGFVASILLRGVNLVQVPTTLLAQVDSSVGGKTAVNLPAGKNLLGTFYQPKMVYIDLGTLATLPRRDLAAGLAEVIKHGLIADAALFGLVEARAESVLAGDRRLHAELVARSVAIKASIVQSDERELAPAAAGGRALLNFGHTIGHALEKASLERDRDPLRHGEAVALGMLAAARVGAALELGGSEVESRLKALLARLQLPVDLDARLDSATLNLIGVDKKRMGNEVSFVLIPTIGQARRIPVELERLAEILLGRHRSSEVEA